MITKPRDPGRYMTLRASLPFVAFVVWLLSVPMEGFLLAHLGLDNAILFFLIPHVGTLAFIGTVFPQRMLSLVAVVGGIAAMISTVLIAHFPPGAHWFLAIAGVGSSFVCVKAGIILKRSPCVAMSAAIGLAAANVLLFAFMAVPLPDSFKSPAAAALLLVPMLARPWPEGEADGESTLVPFLPFVFVFQIVSGLMYGALYRDYAQAAYFPGIELVFYVIAVMAGLALLHRRRETLLALAIVSAMFAFSMFLMEGPVSVNAALFAMQAAAGFLDFYLLALLLAQQNSLRAFGVGLAVTCAGIAAGKAVSLLIGEASHLVVAVANLVLTSSVLVLYLLMRSERRLDAPALQVMASMTEAAETVDVVAGDVQPQSELVLPAGLRKRFSEQEKSVLACVVQGMTFKEAARELAISESSVKTYMKRVYDKMNVSGKEELLAKLGDELKG
jgi:DNA-binding CsgD family transcriptional regulator